MLYHYKNGNDEWKQEKAYYERELSTIGKIIIEVSCFYIIIQILFTSYVLSTLNVSGNAEKPAISVIYVHQIL
jgi:hypothetical protein